MTVVVNLKDKPCALPLVVGARVRVPTRRCARSVRRMR